MSIIVKSGSSGNLLTINGDGSINVTLSGLTALDVSDRSARTLGHVVVDNLPATQPVSGSVAVSNFPGAFSINNFPASFSVNNFPASVMVSNFPATQPVSGSVAVSNFPATQPISGVVNVSNFPATQPVTGTVSVSNFPAVQPVSFTAPARTYITLYVDRVAGRTTEALETLTFNSGGSTASGTAYTVPPGKTFRITSLEVEVQNTGNTINRVIVRVRAAASVLVTSPIVAMGQASATVAVAVSSGQDGISFPEGIDIPDGQQVGISQLCTVTTAGIVSVLLQGYLY